MRSCILAIVLIHTRATDVCTFLAAIDTSGEFIVSGIFPPFCEYTDICLGLRRRTRPLEPLTCEEAFIAITNRNSERINEPPIVLEVDYDTVELYLDSEELYVASSNSSDEQVYYTSLDLSTRVQLDGIANITNLIVDRIFASHPWMVYDETVDGPMLRNLTEQAKSLATQIDDECETIHDLTKYVMRSDSMRAFSRAIKLIIWHVAMQPLLDTEKFIVAAAPWLHAYLKTTFYLKVIYPHFWDDYGWLLLKAVTIHPLYEPDSPVWYVLVALSVEHREYTLRDGSVTWETIEEIFESPIEHDGAFFLRELVSNIEGYLRTRELADDADEVQPFSFAIGKLAYAMEYLSAFESVDFVSLAKPEELFLISKILRSTTPDYNSIGCTAMETLMRLFSRDGFDVSTLRNLLPFLASSLGQVAVRHNTPPRQIIVQYTGHEIQQDRLLQTLLKSSKHDFLMQLEIFGVGTSEVAVPQLISDMLDVFLSPVRGWFEADSSSDDLLDEGSIFYRINPQFAKSNPRIQIAFGRLIGLIVLLWNPDQILNRYIRPPRPDASVFETLFFGSRYIRQGFYDIYLAGSIELSCRNGQHVCAVIESVLITD